MIFYDIIDDYHIYKIISLTEITKIIEYLHRSKIILRVICCAITRL